VVPLVLERAGLNSSAAFAQAVWFLLVLERAGSNSSAAFAQAVWFLLVLEPAHLSLAAERVGDGQATAIKAKWSDLQLAGLLI